MTHTRAVTHEGCDAQGGSPWSFKFSWGAGAAVTQAVTHRVGAPTSASGGLLRETGPPTCPPRPRIALSDIFFPKIRSYVIFGINPQKTSDTHAQALTTTVDATDPWELYVKNRRMQEPAGGAVARTD